MSNNQSEVPVKSSPRHTFYNDGDELDLLDIIAQLWRGKVIIIFSVIIAMLLAAIYLSLAKQKWTSTAIVTAPSAGQVANYNVVLNAIFSQYPQDKLAIGDLQKQLFGRFSASISALSGSLHNLEQPLDLKVEQLVKGQSDSLSISFTDESAKQAQRELTKYIQTINNDVVDEYSADIIRNLEVKRRELSESLALQIQVAKDKKQRRIDAIKQALKIAEDSKIKKTQLQQAEDLSDDSLYLLGSDALHSMVLNENTRPLSLDNYYYETQRALLSVNALKIQVENLQSYRPIMQPDLPIHRDSPKKTLVMILAILLGGIAGSAIVLSRNLVRHYRDTH